MGIPEPTSFDSSEENRQSLSFKLSLAPSIADSSACSE